jgi:hypothetical protein
MEGLDSSTSMVPQGLFSPSDRLVQQGTLLNWVSDGSGTEVEFTEEEGGGLESLLASGCTWTDFLSFMNNKVAWLDEHVLVLSGRSNLERIGAYNFFTSIKAKFGSGPNPRGTAALNVFALPSSRMQARNICDALLLQLLARSQPSRVHLKSLWFDTPLTVSGPAIQELLEQCPDLELLAFMDTILDETQYRALAVASPSTTT